MCQPTDKGEGDMMPFVVVRRLRDTVTIQVMCVVCDDPQTIQIANGQAAELESPNRRKIQEVLPDVPRDQRELLITGTCPKCWKELFGPHPSGPPESKTKQESGRRQTQRWRKS
jgi:hypothetical protein